MNRNVTITLFVFALGVVASVGFIARGDNRASQNGPGAETGAGRSSLLEAEPTAPKRKSVDGRPDFGILKREMMDEKKIV